MEIRNELGPGLLERAYQSILVDELRERGLNVAREVMIPISYKGRVYPEGYRADIVVEDRVIIEVKSVSALVPNNHLQVRTYLKFSKFEGAILVNFSQETFFPDGIHTWCRARP